MPITERQLVQAAAEAVADGMDWFKATRKGLPEPLSRRLHNPGCLYSWHDPMGVPYETAYGFVEFPDDETGWRALNTHCRIQLFKRRKTVLEFFRGHARRAAQLHSADEGIPGAFVDVAVRHASRSLSVDLDVNRAMIDYIRR